MLDRDRLSRACEQARRQRSWRGGDDGRKTEFGKAAVDLLAQPVETTEIIQAAGDFRQHAGRWIDADDRCPLPSPQRDALERSALRTFVAQMNRQFGVQRQRGGNGETGNDATPFGRTVGGDDIGTMTEAADDRRPFPRLTARENTEREIRNQAASDRVSRNSVAGRRSRARPQSRNAG